MSLKEKAKELVTQMTLEEKAGLCSGYDSWSLKGIKPLGLPSVMVADGPHGLRKQVDSSDHLGLNDSVPATCFPTASSLACSFDRELLYEIGKALGEECQEEQVAVLLGPGINQKRSPLCGRNFEYFSEDPLLSGELGASWIQGVQSQRVGTSLKHFAVNNQEKKRMTVDAIVDERALRETYLKAFEIAIKKGKPWTVMSAYNRVNGSYCSESVFLLEKVLREEWGFEGLVVSDWGATNDRVAGLLFGLDLEMPGNGGYNDRQIVEAVEKGILPEEVLDVSACRVTELVLKAKENSVKGFKYDREAHHQLAVRAAEESAVLLKNIDNILPGNFNQNAAIVGVFAKEPRYQGSGSSKVKPFRLDNAWDALTEAGLRAEYASGYSLDNHCVDEHLLTEACRVAQDKDIVYVFVGLPDSYESEGFDRKDLSLPESHNRLVEELVTVNQNIVVVLLCGAPVELPWADKVKAILLGYLGGQGGGRAIANLLMGKAIPSGKLAETWPVCLEDTPSYQHFPGDKDTVEYRESIFVGYRYYNTFAVEVRYPFGHGLSYSSFAYSDMEIDKKDKVTVSFTIKNIGNYKAREIAQVYVSSNNDRVFRPANELRGFKKVLLEPGQSTRVSVVLNPSAFAYYNTLIKDWYVKSGTYTIMVGPSSTVFPLTTTVQINSPRRAEPDYLENTSGYFNGKFSREEFAVLYGLPLPEGNRVKAYPFDINDTLHDVEVTFFGRLFVWVTKKVALRMAKDKETKKMVASMLPDLPIRAIMFMGGKTVPPIKIEGILDLINKKYLKGIQKILRG